MSEDEGNRMAGTPPPPTGPTTPAGGSPYTAPPPGPASTAPAGFSVQLPAINVQEMAKTPWVVGAAAILIGLAIFWAGSIISAFQNGLTARQAIIDILGPGTVTWALAVLLAVALLVLGSSGQGRTPLATFLYQVLLLASALIAVAAVINAIIEITYLGSSADFAIYSFLEYLAAVPIAGAAALWAWQVNPVALPGQKAKAKAF